MEARMKAERKDKHIRVTREAHSEIAALSTTYRVSIPDLMDLAVRSLKREIQTMNGNLCIGPVEPAEGEKRGPLPLPTPARGLTAARGVSRGAK